MLFFMVNVAFDENRERMADERRVGRFLPPEPSSYPNATLTPWRIVWEKLIKPSEDCYLESDANDSDSRKGPGC
jgi:hypothetical protein